MRFDWCDGGCGGRVGLKNESGYCTRCRDKVRCRQCGYVGPTVERLVCRDCREARRLMGEAHVLSPAEATLSALDPEAHAARLKAHEKRIRAGLRAEELGKRKKRKPRGSR